MVEGPRHVALDAVTAVRKPYRVRFRDQIRDAIDPWDCCPVRFDPHGSQASVAIVISEKTSDPEICFIQRTVRADDPWSGHVSFPGGRAEPADRSPADVAERETREEIGLELTETDRVGALRVLPRIRRGLTLFPLVYCIDAGRQSEAGIQAPDEVDRVFWVPLSHLTSSRFVTSLDYRLDGRRQTFPAIRYEQHLIWGLTLHLVSGLAAALKQPFPALD